jgi:hypothetical protein
MKIIGESLRKDNKHFPESIRRMMDSVTSDPEWIREMDAQEMVVRMLQRALDNRYLLIRNGQLKGVKTPIMLLLIGPTGVSVPYVSSVKGNYQASSESWEKFNDFTKNYRPERNNLITKVIEINEVVDDYLKTRGFPNLINEPVLIFTDPGMHVILNHPVIRIIMLDALDRFVANLANQPQIMRWKESQRLISCLAEDKAIVLDQPPELIVDEFALIDEQRKPIEIPEIPLSYPDDKPVLEAMQKVPFSSKQIVFLGVLVVINVVLILAFLAALLILK